MEQRSFRFSASAKRRTELHANEIELLESARLGRKSRVEMLLAEGVAPDVQIPERHCKNTALALAAIGNHFNVVELLLQHNVNVNNCDVDQDTPLIYASWNSNFKMCKALLQAGADPNQMNAIHQTPLWNACFKGNLDLVKYLCELNVKTNVSTVGYPCCTYIDPDYRMYTTPRSPLFAAVEQNNLDVVEYLIEIAGCDLKQEGWLWEQTFLNELEPFMLELSTELRSYLQCVRSTPQSLRHQCKQYLRNVFHHDMTSVSELELPHTLVKYLQLKLHL